MPIPEIRLIEYSSAEYQQELELRFRVLREPLGLKLAPTDLQSDSGDFHVGAFTNGQMVGCLILSPKENGVVKMRQVAVDPIVQGGGIGKAMVAFAERFAKKQSFKEIQLNARETAVKFYVSLNYEIYDAAISEIGIPHRKMKKSLFD